jgi:hypothetical protein
VEITVDQNSSQNLLNSSTCGTETDGNVVDRSNCDGRSLATYPSAQYRKSKLPKRLDYIISSLNTYCVKGPFVSGSQWHLSDHNAVGATLCLYKPDPLPIELIPTDFNSASLLQKRKEMLVETLQCVTSHLGRVVRWQIFFDTVTILCLLLFIGLTITCAVTIPNDMLTTLLIIVFFAVQPILTITMVITFFIGRVCYQQERTALRSTGERWQHFIDCQNLYNALEKDQSQSQSQEISEL